MTDDSLLPRTKAAPERCKDGPATILVGVDGSTSSLRAAAYAAGMARRQRSRLVAVYVRQPGAYAVPVPGATGTVLAAQDLVEQELRSAIEHRVVALDVDVQLVVRSGEPYTELLDVAEEVHPDAVIVGRSSKMLHRIAGSLAVKLTRCGRWPVTVVP
ncbi:universal stress protein [Actinoplanes sp. KI2]|uniref:universal stress protein n=1 Tax=Actinoplanes sp. KI2 TaxID=2983315 RepID=UPI0021D59F36|nr:universal stress protein [Actinoplanes sp. KI2]MCU7726291.1 universal stress protein [Actinoplanes sp. KI2]